MTTQTTCASCGKETTPQEAIKQAAAIISALLTDHPFALGEDAVTAALRWLDKYAPLPFTVEAGHCGAVGD